MKRKAISFPSISSALGGAQAVEYNARTAWIYLPSQPHPVQIARRLLPPIEQWSAFNLADAATGSSDIPRATGGAGAMTRRTSTDKTFGQWPTIQAKGDSVICSMHRTEFIPATTMDEACELAPWAFKIIKFMDGYIAFDGPIAAHLWTQKRHV